MFAKPGKKNRTGGLESLEINFNREVLGGCFREAIKSSMKILDSSDEFSSETKLESILIRAVSRVVQSCVRKRYVSQSNPRGGRKPGTVSANFPSLFTPCWSAKHLRGKHRFTLTKGTKQSVASGLEGFLQVGGTSFEMLCPRHPISTAGDTLRKPSNRATRIEGAPLLPVN